MCARARARARASVCARAGERSFLPRICKLNNKYRGIYTRKSSAFRLHAARARRGLVAPAARGRRDPFAVSLSSAPLDLLCTRIHARDPNARARRNSRGGDTSAHPAGCVFLTLSLSLPSISLLWSLFLSPLPPRREVAFGSSESVSLGPLLRSLSSLVSSLWSFSIFLRRSWALFILLHFECPFYCFNYVYSCIYLVFIFLLYYIFIFMMCY